MSPAMADQWLVQEISRGACDPGALGVFRSDPFYTQTALIASGTQLTRGNSNERVEQI